MHPRDRSADDVPTVSGEVRPDAVTDAAGMPRLVPIAPGRYTILGILGRGGQSVVHRAHDAAIGREVALKEILPGLAGGPEADAAVARFLREARVTGQLEHPSIVPVHEVGVKPDGSPYCVQKLVRGRTLAAALADCRDATESLALLPHLIAACQAVAFAHGHGVIHRDIKPANIMVGELGETFVLDWGLARVLGEPADAPGRLSPDVASAGLTVTGSGLGTPGYASPEQAAGDHERVDRRSDVWSLGVIVQQVIAGPAAKASAPPRELVAIARRALAPDPDARYPSAAEMAADLEAFRDGRMVSAHEYRPWELVRRLVAEHRALASAIGVGLAVLIVALVLISRAWAGARANLAEAFTQQGHRAASDRDWPVAEASHAVAASLRDSPASRWGAALAAAGDPVAGPAWLARDGQAIDLAISADSRLVLTSGGHHAAIWRIESGANVCRIVGVGTSLAAAVFDGDGMAWTVDHEGVVVGFEPSSCREIARHATGIELRDACSESSGKLLLSVEGGGAVRLDTGRGTIEPLAGAPFDVRWEVPSPRGDHIVSMFPGDTFALRTAGEPPGARRPTGHHQSLNEVAFSPDGSLFATSSSDRTVLLRSWPDGAEQARLTGHAGAVGRAAFSPDGTLVATPSQDGVMVWSARHGRLHARFSAGLNVRAVAFTPDGRTLVTGGDGGDVRTWHFPGWARRIVGGQAGAPRALGFSPDGAHVLAGDWDGDVRVIRVSDGAVLARVHAHEAVFGVNALAVHPSGELVATAGNDGSVATWTLPSLEALSRIAPGEREAFGVTWSPDGETLWSSWGTGVVLHHDRSLRVPLARLQAHERAGAISLEVSRDGRILVTSSRDRTARVWDVDTLTLRRELRTEGSALAAALSPDARTVATATDTGRVTTWDWETGKKLTENSGHEHWAADVDFRPDGRVLVSAGLDAVRFWDVRSGEQLATSEISAQGAIRAAWSHDGSWLATTAPAGVVQFQPVGDPSQAVDLEEVLARRRLRRDGMTFRDLPP